MNSFYSDPDQVVEEDEIWYWTVSIQEDGAVNEVPVCQGGETRLLRRSEVKSYVKQALQFYLLEYKRPEFEAFSEGFYLVAGAQLFHLVEPEDLKLCMCGVDVIDWMSLKEKARYNPPYTEHHPLIKALWDFALSLDPDDSRRLLSLW